MALKLVAQNLTNRKCFAPKLVIRHFSSKIIPEDGSSKLTATTEEKTQALEFKEPQDPTPKMKSFSVAHATKDHFPNLLHDSSTHHALVPNTKDAVNTAAGLIKVVADKVLTSDDSPPPPTGWSLKFKLGGFLDINVKRPDTKKMTEVTKKFTEEGLVVRIMAPGFKKAHISLTVEGNMLYVMGKCKVDGKLKEIDEVVQVNPEHLFDAEKVSAVLDDGYLKVTFPKGSKDTMASEVFIVKWA